MPWPSVMVTAVPGLCGCRGPVFSGPVPILLHHVTDDRVDGPWAEVDGHGDVLGERLSQMMGGVYSPGAIRMAAGPAGSSMLRRRCAYRLPTASSQPQMPSRRTPPPPGRTKIKPGPLTRPGSFDARVHNAKQAMKV